MKDRVSVFLVVAMVIMLSGCRGLFDSGGGGGGGGSDNNAVSVSGVSLDPTNATIEVGEQLQLNATVEPSDANDTSVTWSSDNDSVVTVDTEGVVAGVSVGDAVVTVSTVDGGFSAETAITVTATADGGGSDDGAGGDDESGDDGSSDGDAGAGGDGSGGADDSGNNDGDEPQTTPVTGVSITPESATLLVGETVDMVPTVEPAGADDTAVSWTSSDEAVAAVDADGGVTGVGAGDATITVTTSDGGFTATSEITVQLPAGGSEIDINFDTPSEPEITIAASAAEIAKGATLDLNATQGFTSYRWFVDEVESPAALIGSGHAVQIETSELFVGPHSVELLVSDGPATFSADFSFTVTSD